MMPQNQLLNYTLALSSTVNLVTMRCLVKVKKEVHVLIYNDF
uniref:Uncharacterized protein n=1 Tax=Arundo donax TaxID=35708 RepID=A0A0A9GIQ2_ARUDO